MTCQLPTRRSSAVAVLVGLVLCGCGSSQTSAPATATPNPASIEHGTISVGGLAHAYRLFRPQKLNAQNPTAMVVLLHGCGSSGDMFASITRTEPTLFTTRLGFLRSK